MVRPYGGACESSQTSSHLMVFIMEAHCVLCEIRTEYLYAVRSTKLSHLVSGTSPCHRCAPSPPPGQFLLARGSSPPPSFSPPSRPPPFLRAVTLISFNQFYEDVIMGPRRDSTPRLTATRNVTVTLTSLQKVSTASSCAEGKERMVI